MKKFLAILVVILCVVVAIAVDCGILVALCWCFNIKLTLKVFIGYVIILVILNEIGRRWRK